MNFQLRKLIIWPKDTSVAPRVVEFRLGMLNVITGASRTGKSAIIPIIDYCLASSDCFIPIDTIRDHASWYGIVVQTDTEEILIARSVPDGRTVSNEFYVQRGSTVSIPPIVEEPNQNTPGVKLILNTISSVPYFSLDGNGGGQSYQARLGFRDLMALVFQTQDIVANQNILFYKTHKHEHRERLRNWFPFILGAETIDVLKARQRLQEIDKNLKQLRHEFEKARQHSSSWVNNMLGHLKVAKEYGLLDEVVLDDTTSEQLILTAKSLVEEAPEHIRTEPADINAVTSEMQEYETKEDELSTQIGLVKRRLSDLKRLKSGFKSYGDAVRHRVERLHISQWLRDIATDGNACPACGSQEHPRGKLELEEIAQAFVKYEQEAKSVEEIPTSFAREEMRLEEELDSLLKEQKDHQNRYDILMARDRQIQMEFQSRKNMFLFLGHLKASMETFESLGDGGEFLERITLLEQEHAELAKIADPSGVKRRVEAATGKISQGMLKHLQTLDVEEKYRESVPKFDVTDLNVSVLSTDGNWHYLAEVGSASNWVSFHLALFCSLQEYFTKQKASPVPSFVIFDQPSQVYFPKVNRESEKRDDDPDYEDEDVDAVKKMFRTVADAIIARDGAWQAIILDHADESIYGDIDGICEVDDWRGDNKLIPVEWYS